MAIGARARFWLTYAVIAALVTIPFSVTLFFVWLDMDEVQRNLLRMIAPHWLPIGTAVTVLSLVLAGVALHRLYRVYVQGLAAMAEQLDVMRTAPSGFRIPSFGPPEVRRVAEAANRLAEAKEAAATEVQARIDEAKRSAVAERNRLAALMAQLDEAVVVCNPDGRVLLYNEAARQLVAAFVGEQTAVAATSALGLGRTVFTWIDPAVLGHALDTVNARLQAGDTAPRARFVIVAPTGRVARVRVAPVTASGETTLSGFVLVIDDVTEMLEREAQRSQVLFEMTEGNRASLANVQMAVEMLGQPDLSPELGARFRDVIARELTVMRTRLDRAVNEVRETLATRWPREPIAVSELVALAERFVSERLSVTVRLECDAVADHWVAADAFSWLRMVAALVERLRDDYDADPIRFRVRPDGKGWIHWDLVWHGGALSSEIVSGWELEPVVVRGERYPFTVREVLERHGAAMWFDRVKARHEAFLRLAIAEEAVASKPQGTAVEAKTLEAPAGQERETERPLFFDFDLFAWGAHVGDLDNRRLSELAYTVFDTETTGLRPSEGDEIIQIGAVRIVNGRVLREEAFEQLIDPQRPLAKESIAIHGIQPEMLVGQPTAEVVLPLFHRYAEGTVLVAHNAAFDMRFLELKEAKLGIRFDQPVLDTLLLAYFLFPNQDSNRLEALAERFGIRILGRHTALGDAIVTAEAFVKMIPLLEERGVRTLKAAREAAQQTYLAKLRY